MNRYCVDIGVCVFMVGYGSTKRVQRNKEREKIYVIKITIMTMIMLIINYNYNKNDGNTYRWMTDMWDTSKEQFVRVAVVPLSAAATTAFISFVNKRLAVVATDGGRSWRMLFGSRYIPDVVRFGRQMKRGSI